MFLLLFLPLLPLADPPKPVDPPADVAVLKHLRAQVAEIEKHVLDDAKTKAEWEAKRPKLTGQLFDMLGLAPLPEKTDLHATVTGTLDIGDVSVEKLHFQSRPGLYVTANLYRPRLVPKGKKFPTILYQCGHSNQGRDGNKTHYQRHGLWFASNGYVCLMVDTLQLGEIAGKHHGTHNLNRFWWHSRGYTPAGVECWNSIRAIDYLVSRPDVDGSRIGATGRSGGGAGTVWIAATDDRVKVAIPVSGISDLSDYVGEKVINGHCDCMFGYNPYRWEWTTHLALFAPKPMMFANSDADPIFPMAGNRRIADRMRKCYEMLGKPDLFEEFVTPGKHEDGPELRKASFRFFNAHLKGDPKAKVEDTEFAAIPGKDLRVFPTDADLPKDSINDKIDQTFVPVADVKLPAKAEDFPAWKVALVKQLRDRVFADFPKEIPPAKVVIEELAVSSVTADDGFKSTAILVLIKPKRLDEEIPETPQLVVVLNDQEGAVAEARRHAGKWDLNGISLHPRGTDGSRWTRKNPPNTVERSFVLLGTTADAGRVRDVAGYLVSIPKGTKVKLCGSGNAGVIAAYAALLVPDKVAEVVIHDPPVSHDDGPHFLNVRRVLDIPDALGLLAPNTKVTITGKVSKAFDKTARIFELAGAKGKLKRE